jgi:hypothetical protein
MSRLLRMTSPIEAVGRSTTSSVIAGAKPMSLPPMESSSASTCRPPRLRLASSIWPMLFSHTSSPSVRGPSSPSRISEPVRA